MTDTINDVVINYKSVGFDQTNAELQSLGKSVDGVVVEFEGLNKSTISIQNQFAGLEKRFQTTAGQAAQFADVQAKVNKAIAQNPSLLQQGNDILDAARAKYGLVADAEGALSVAHDRLSQQSQALFHALRGSFEQLAAGVPPTQALTQQLNHLTFAATGEGGLAGAFGGVVQIFRNMISPTTVAIGGMVALGAAVAVAVSQYDKLQVSSQRAIGGAGQRTGTTVEDINAFASQNSSSFGLSSKQARTLGEDLTSTGDIVISKLHNMNDAIVGFAHQTGDSLDQASKAFVEFAQDPVQAFDKLSKVFGDVDPKFRNLAEQVAATGDKTAAINIVVDAFSDKVSKAAANTTIWGKALDILRTTSARATSALQPSGIDTQIAETKARLDAAIAEGSEGAQRLAPDDARLNVISDAVAKLSQRLVELQQAKEKAASGALEASLEHTAALAENATRAILPQIAAIEKYQEEINQLNAAIEAGKGGPNTGNALAVAEHLQQVAQESLDATVRQADAVRQLQADYGGVSAQTAVTLNNLQGQLQVAQAVTVAAQQRAQMEATISQLIAQGTAEEEAAAIASQQYAIAQAQATSNVQRQVEALKDSTAMIKAQQNGTEEATAAAIAYKNAIASGADSTSAAALKSATLANYMAKAAGSAGQLSQNLAQAYQGMLSIAGAASTFDQLGVPFAPDNSGDSGPGFTATFDVPEGHRVTPTAYVSPNIGSSGSSIAAGQVPDALFGTMAGAQQYVYNELNFGASLGIAGSSTYGANNHLSGSNLNLTAPSAATAVNNLTTSVDNLNTSTKNLNSTMQEALSPYYTVDPRTSHIGFRSQGMASGGWVDVPGSPSANDNMIATVPVASGERIYIDPMSSRRSTSGGTTNINITVPVQIVGNVANDQNAIGRTVYQAAQTAARQLKAAQ